MAQQKRGAQQVRIIGGKFRGRKLRFSGGASLRPTLSRTRETLFNWLRPVIAETRCLDAFAGSGALGFEALSQGANEVVLVEQSPRTAKTLQDAARALDCEDNARIIKADVLGYLKHVDEPFDIAFVDPPFHQIDLLDKTLQVLVAGQLVRAYIYVEAPTQISIQQAAAEAGWQVSRQTRSGDAHAALLAPPP